VNATTILKAVIPQKAIDSVVATGAGAVLAVVHFSDWKPALELSLLGSSIALVLSRIYFLFRNKGKESDDE
jgi:hypothetical protein